MPSPEPAAPPMAGSLRIWIFVVCLVVACGFLPAVSWQRLREIRLATATTVNGATLPRPDPSSPTGYANGCRNLIFPLGFSDGMEWIILTQEMIAKGEWRLRATDGDNWPAGREVHWSSPLMWWLIACAKVARLWNGESLAAAVESVAPWANTLFLFLLLAFLPLHAGRRFGWPAGGVVALGLVTLYPLYEFFSVGYPDHHGLVTAGCLLGAYALAAGGGGWVGDAGGAAPSPDTARRSFAAAGLAGAFALWISAATAIPVITALGLGGLVVSRLARGRTPVGMRYEPRLWRWWSWTGAAGSLAFYLLEYFPGHLGMRLEVNHPLYALAWLAGGEIVCRAGAWLAGGRLAERRGDRALLAAAFCAVALPPALALLFPGRFFLVSDPFVWALHRDYIVEFAPVWRRLREMPWADSLTVYGGAVPVALAGTAATLLWRRLDVTWRSRLLLVVAPALVVTLLGCRQSRWLGVCYGLWIAVIPVWLGALAATELPHGPWSRIVPVLLVIGMLPFPFQAATTWWHLFRPTQMARTTAAMLYVRDISQRLRLGTGNSPLVVASGPTTTTWLMYYGGARGLGTLYWENAAGLKASAAIFGARTDEEALAQIRRHGVTHLVHFSKNLFATPYTRLAQGLGPDRQPKEGFVLRALRTGQLPPWATAYTYPVPQGLDLLGDWVQVWEVKPQVDHPIAQGASSP